MAEKEKEQEFQVHDRRHFDQDGNVRETSTGVEEPKTEKQSHLQPEEHGSSGQKVDFISIVLPYASAALVYLGELKDAGKDQAEENLDAARQMIDLLEVLQDKTRGNLTKHEQQYLETVLFDLRMRYMQKAKLIK